jgi:hypothetical protein
MINKREYISANAAGAMNQLQYNGYNNAFYAFAELVPIKGLLRNSEMMQEAFTAPTYQQATDWLRETYGLVVDVFQEFDEEAQGYTGKWEVDISELQNYKEPHTVQIDTKFDDYYKAWEAGIAISLGAVALQRIKKL